MAEQKSVMFFDIDGTLLDHEKNLPNSTKEAIQELKRMGHIVAIATGRGPFMYKDLREELGINTYVSYNGQYVVVEGKEVYTNPLDKSSLKKLTEQALLNEHSVVFMDPNVMKAKVPEHPFITESIQTLKVSLPAYAPLHYEENEIFQTLLFCEEKDEKQYKEAYPEFDFIRWHPYSTDVLPKGGSKANVHLRHVLERINNRLHHEHKRSHIQLMEEEKAVSLPAIAPFDVADLIECCVDKYSTITIHQNRYSVPEGHVDSYIKAKVGAETIKLFIDGKLAAEHLRSWGLHQWIMDINHFLE